MELTHLRYLAAIAEAGNVGRAAATLHVSQPALSASLRRLESELGIRLFDRRATGVTPTAAGREVISDARRVVGQADRLVDTARRHATGEAGVLRVGFEASGAGRLTTQARAEFARRHPGVRVEPKRFDWGEETAALRDGRADVAFVWLPNDLTGLVVEVVHTEPRVVGMAAGHRLADRKGISVLEINHDPLMWTASAPREWVDWWAVNPRPDGSAPHWGPTNDNVEEMLEQVAEGTAVCIAPAGLADYYGRVDLRWVPVTDVEPLRVALGWPEGGDTPLVRGFAAVVRDLRA